KVVQHQQEVLVPQQCTQGISRLVPRIMEAKRMSNRGEYQSGVMNGGQGDESDTISKVLKKVCCDLDRQARLANACSSTPGHQSDLRPAQKRRRARRFLLASNERRQLHRQSSDPNRTLGALCSSIRSIPYFL